MEQYLHFKKLHTQNTPLILGNIWDANSAKIFERAGFQALGTSSAAVADMLGYQDGEEISFSELEYIVTRIISNISIPLSVDIEGGYSRNARKIINNIKRLSDLGVVGINIEDSVVINNRVLQDIDKFGEIISQVKKELKEEDIEIFMNVRTDPYILGLEDSLKKTIERIKVYEEAGADGIFVPCITEIKDIQKIISSTTLPLNVLTVPDLPSFDILAEIGVKRISLGDFPYRAVMGNADTICKYIFREKSFQSLFV